jgi:hypothetical protein
VQCTKCKEHPSIKDLNYDFDDYMIPKGTSVDFDWFHKQIGYSHPHPRIQIRGCSCSNQLKFVNPFQPASAGLNLRILWIKPQVPGEQKSPTLEKVISCPADMSPTTIFSCPSLNSEKVFLYYPLGSLTARYSLHRHI